MYTWGMGRPGKQCVYILLLAACGGGEVATDTAITTATSTTTTTATGETAASAGTTGATTEVTTEASDTSSEGTTTGPCGDCPPHFLCKYDQCLPNLGPCESHDDCPGDAYCDADGQCIPYDTPDWVDQDSECLKPMPPDGVAPAVQCAWAGTEPGDPTAVSTHIYSMPVVADLNLNNAEIPAPSIIVTTWHNPGEPGRLGMLRVFDGRTCEEQMRAGGLDVSKEQRLADMPGYGSQWAVADLDGDVPEGGHPEIVGLHRFDPDDITEPLNLYAFAIDSSGDKPELVRQWYGRDCLNDQIVSFSIGHANHGPSVLDLDDDGVPEIVMDEMVFDAQGCLLSPYADFLYTDVGLGLMSAVVDVDLDGLPDLVRHNTISSWNAQLGQWQQKPWFIPSEAQLAGHVGVADAGAFSDVPGVMVAHAPEIVVVSASIAEAASEDSGSIRLQALDGEIVWGPVPLYHLNGQYGGRGGPPTISDFDGDGQVEFAAAGAFFYAVYDPDCGPQPLAERPGGTCERAPDMQGLPDGVLWAQPSQDYSSNITGSSIFDFDGDGTGEAVYRDECFLRVYNGATGEVIFSAPAWSGTGLDYPVVADVDADFATEIVVPLGGDDLDLTCPEYDPLFPGGEPSEPGTGFVVLRDPEDRWASSRPIWNQHVYSITHITDDAQVLPASEVEPNWLTPGLNNFRQNTEGAFGLFEVADLTAELAVPQMCGLAAGEATLVAEVCNRGTAPAPAGASVGFFEAPDVQTPPEQAAFVCATSVDQIVLPTECVEVSCAGSVEAAGPLYVHVDADGTQADCHPGNNLGPGSHEVCP